MSAKSKTAVAPLHRIRLLVLDADGVLTDGRLHYGSDGTLSQVFHARDGVGLKALMAAGVQVAVISGRRSPPVALRCAELGITEIHQGADDKATVLNALLARLGLKPSQCACMGDDAPDVPMMRVAGLAVTVADAHPVARAAAHRRTRLAGGAGAVREVCDWLLAALPGPARPTPQRATARKRR